MKKKKENRKSLFDELFEKEVCFAVCVASNSFVREEVRMFSTDWFVIINRSDERRIDGFTFYSTEEYRRVCERKLSAEDIKEFKSMTDRFVKVVHNAYGRVYELRGKPFKAALNRRRRQIVVRG